MDGYVLYLVILVGAIVVVAVAWAKAYNRLVRLNNRADAMRAEVDVQLKRRHDLVPNLVAAVGGYAGHERTTLDEVTQARNMALAARTQQDQAKAENLLTASLGRLFADAESYPQLKADQGFEQLQSELVDVEREIAQARGAYNLTVQQLNNAIETVPTSIVAWFSSLSELEYLGADEAERATPDVQFAAPAAPSA